MNSRQVLRLLQRFESRNVTFVEANGSWPIVWERARGCQVWDSEGRRYLDLTGAFGVAAAGHANRRVISAATRQMDRLVHAMGDVHPHEPKANLVRELSRLTFERWSKGRVTGKATLCNSGFEAVEAALKTARLATGRSEIIAFEGAYHGLGYGALNATHREHFRQPFRNQLREFAHFLPFPTNGITKIQWKYFETKLRQTLQNKKIGALLVEPIQVRGGINVPPPRFLKTLRRECDRAGALLILDEIYTGFGRTGAWFACEHSGVMPDLICLGKALTGGFPLSACVGNADLMDRAWPASSGEAIHTSTYLGHPVGCVMALAQISELSGLKLIKRSQVLGAHLLKSLRQIIAPGLRLNVRGLGLLAGLELLDADGEPATAQALAAVKVMLHRGFILLPEGEHANVISFSPPLTITERELDRTVLQLGKVLLQ
jgi:4-aminobutyrate aminotransferase-like enzyme